MILRHLIPWIPGIGFLYVFFFFSMKIFYKKYTGHCTADSYTKYTWGSNWAYTITIFVQAFGIFYILKLIYNV